ncbi:hypothetical protein [Rhodococcus tukisamuensis]
MYLVRALAAGLVTVIAVGVPTDIIDTRFFGREVPARGWEHPVHVATATLTALWFGIRPGAQERRPTGAMAGVVLAVISLAMLTIAVVLRRRQSLCGPDCAGPAERTAAAQEPSIAQ